MVVSFKVPDSYQHVDGHQTYKATKKLRSCSGTTATHMRLLDRSDDLWEDHVKSQCEEASSSKSHQVTMDLCRRTLTYEVHKGDASNTSQRSSEVPEKQPPQRKSSRAQHDEVPM